MTELGFYFRTVLPQEGGKKWTMSLGEGVGWQVLGEEKERRERRDSGWMEWVGRVCGPKSWECRAQVQGQDGDSERNWFGDSCLSSALPLRRSNDS